MENSVQLGRWGRTLSLGSATLPNIDYHLAANEKLESGCALANGLKSALHDLNQPAPQPHRSLGVLYCLLPGIVAYKQIEVAQSRTFCPRRKSKSIY